MYKKHFKGNIFFKSPSSKTLTPFMHYEAPHVDPDFSQTLMGQFDEINFTMDEKSKLTVAHRKLLTQFREINIFNLRIHMKHFLQHLEKANTKSLEIHAEGYGAFIVLAAIYSGEVPKNKNMAFYFTNIPVALFPKNLAKTKTVPKNCTMHFEVLQDSWIEPFSTLMNHENIKFKFLKAS